MSASDSWDYILKFILIGDSSVGKSSILVRLTDSRFLKDPDPTVSARAMANAGSSRSLKEGEIHGNW